MFEISKRVSDKDVNLAAVLGMYDKFRSLFHDPISKNNPVFHLLYEWDIGGGEREDLVASLNEIGLRHLARQ